MNKNHFTPTFQNKSGRHKQKRRNKGEKKGPRTSFSRRLSSTRTGSEPCKRVIMSSTSEPAREIGGAATLGFLRAALKEAEEESGSLAESRTSPP